MTFTCPRAGLAAPSTLSSLPLSAVTVASCRRLEADIGEISGLPGRTSSRAASAGPYVGFNGQPRGLVPEDREPGRCGCAGTISAIQPSTTSCAKRALVRYRHRSYMRNPIVRAISDAIYIVFWSMLSRCSCSGAGSWNAPGIRFGVGCCGAFARGPPGWGV